MNPQKDLLGNQLTDDEKELLELFRRLQTLSRREELPPCALMNVKQAMVLLWNAVVDLDVLYEEPGCD